MSVWRPEFEAALELFASVSAAVVRRGFAAPVLVGGAAVELYSGSAIATGDFDLVTPRQDVVDGRAVVVLDDFERGAVGHGAVGADEQVPGALRGHHVHCVESAEQSWMPDVDSFACTLR